MKIPFLDIKAGYNDLREEIDKEWNARRKTIAHYYLNELQRLPELVLPFVPADIDPVWHLFVVRHPCRDELQRHLVEAGIGTLIHYPVPPHLSGAYSSLGYRRGTFQVAESMADSVLSRLGLSSETTLCNMLLVV